MTLTSSGYNCDFCGKYILGLCNKDKVYPIKLKGFTQMVDACCDCLEIVKNITDGDWKKLPDGRVRKAFEEQEIAVTTKGE